MLTISVVSVFYTSLVGIILLLSYKMFMIRKGHHTSKNGFDEQEFFSKVCWMVLDKIHKVLSLFKKIIISPMYNWIKCNFKLTCRGFTRFVKDMQSIREKPGTVVENTGTSSSYLKSMLAQKKNIQNRK